LDTIYRKIKYNINFSIYPNYRYMTNFSEYSSEGRREEKKPNEALRLGSSGKSGRSPAITELLFPRL
jgi:hypothetical protein